MDKVSEKDNGACYYFEAHLEKPKNWDTDRVDDDTNIEVIETKAVDDLQAKLDEAAALLKEYKDCYGTPIGLNERCDEFLKGLGEG